jgi:hypothetical protein
MKDIVKHKKVYQIQNIRFGRLVAKEISSEASIDSKGRKKLLWRCVCDCGKEVVIPTASLIAGNTRSCGCLRDEQFSRIAHRGRWALPEGECARNNLYCSYAKGAAKRAMVWELSRENFQKMISDNCYYCGLPPQNITRYQHVKSQIKYNGIDRVDNSKGYTLDNSVPCCKTCNLMKMKISKDEFIDKCKLIAIHNNDSIS